MRGSEKQIVWATELKTAAIKTINELVPLAKAAGAPDAAIATWTARIDKLETCDIAGAIIDQFQGFRVTGDIKRDVVSLNAKYTIGTNRYGYKFN